MSNANDNGPPTFQEQLYQQSYGTAETPPPPPSPPPPPEEEPAATG